jgi:hypothetical protein
MALATDRSLVMALDQTGKQSVAFHVGPSNTKYLRIACASPFLITYPNSRNLKNRVCGMSTNFRIRI